MRKDREVISMLSKKVLTALATLALVAVPAAVMAGDFHTGITLVCSDCHVMHYSQQHGYNADGTGTFTPLNNGPHEFLLRDDINDLCRSCHDGQSWAPDVFESHGNGFVRQAGALNEVGGNGLYPETTGHTLGSTDTAPGGTFNDPVHGLTCVNCHAAHGGNAGGNSYRNLGGYGTAVGSATAISYSRGDVEGSNDLNLWVFEDQSSGNSVNHYGRSAITFNEPVGATSVSAYGDFCKGCHTNFHGAVGGAEIGGVLDPVSGYYEEFIRHPSTSESDIGGIGGGHSRLTQLTGHTNQVQVMSPAGQRADAYDGTDTGLSPSCFSCHKGHGNQNAFGLIYMTGTGTVTEEGDQATGAARDLCRQCHGQGA